MMQLSDYPTTFADVDAAACTPTTPAGCTLTNFMHALSALTKANLEAHLGTTGSDKDWLLKVKSMIVADVATTGTKKTGFRQQHLQP